MAYTERLIKAGKMLPKGTAYHTEVFHDPNCRLLKGKSGKPRPCTCKPDISMRNVSTGQTWRIGPDGVPHGEN